MTSITGDIWYCPFCGHFKGECFSIRIVKRNRLYYNCWLCTIFNVSLVHSYVGCSARHKAYSARPDPLQACEGCPRGNPLGDGPGHAG